MQRVEHGEIALPGTQKTWSQPWAMSWSTRIWPPVRVAVSERIEKRSLAIGLLGTASFGADLSGSGAGREAWEMRGGWRRRCSGFHVSGEETIHDMDEFESELRRLIANRPDCVHSCVMAHRGLPGDAGGIEPASKMRKTSGTSGGRVSGSIKPLGSNATCVNVPPSPSPRADKASRISPTRRNIEAFVDGAAPSKSRNKHLRRSKRKSRHTGRRRRRHASFEWLLRAVKPRVIVATAKRRKKRSSILRRKPCDHQSI